ncbi:hypothetical protein K438DRAFT_1946330 [Mycena galopus ATCC 62051]|nr:hypothetical protein K438DRAFT_1946330 [Mycena galopus ATCC 62051]
MKNRKRLPHWRPQREIQLKKDKRDRGSKYTSKRGKRKPCYGADTIEWHRKLQKHALRTGVTISRWLDCDGRRSVSFRPENFHSRGRQVKKFGKALAMILLWENVFWDFVNAQKGNAVRRVHEGIAIHDLFSIHIKGMSSRLEAGALDISTEPLSLPKPQGKNNIALVLKWLYAPKLYDLRSGWAASAFESNTIILGCFTSVYTRNTAIGSRGMDPYESRYSSNRALWRSCPGRLSKVEKIHRGGHTHDFKLQDVAANVWKSDQIIWPRIALRIDEGTGWTEMI